LPAEFQIWHTYASHSRYERPFNHSNPKTILNRQTSFEDGQASHVSLLQKMRSASHLATSFGIASGRDHVIKPDDVGPKLRKVMYVGKSEMG